jgi:hypothetical protein
MISNMIPIIPPEEVEERVKIKRGKTEKIDVEKKIEIIKKEIPTEGEEDILAQILSEAVGEEGYIEGKEEDILKKVLEEIEKEEKKRAIKQRRIERREKAAVPIGPLVPRFITAEKEHIHEKPIVPTEDSCCNKLCKDLNDEIFSKEESLGAVTPVFVKGVPPMYKGLFSIPYAIEALKDYRSLLNDKNICKCYEETKNIEAPLPIVKGEPAKLISAKTGKPITLAPGIPRFELPKTLIHIAHRKDIPTVPIHDGCCIDACNILTKKISKMENMLDKIELRGGKALRPMLGRDPRYEALAYKTFALQEYRSKLTKKNICECLKQ